MVVTEDTLEKKGVSQRREELLADLKVDEEGILDKVQKAKMRELMKKHLDIFSLDDTDLGLIKHRIDLVDEVPFKQRHRRIPPAMVDEVRQHLEQILSSSVIRPSRSRLFVCLFTWVLRPFNT